MRSVLCCTLFLIILPISAMADSIETPDLQPATSEQFSVGQVWKYKTREGEEDSRVIIGKVASSPKIGVIVHVQLVGLRIKNNIDGGVIMSLSHAPMTENALAGSITELSGGSFDETSFNSGYETWRDQFRYHGAGVFTISLSEVVDYIEQTINQSN